MRLCNSLLKQKHNEWFCHSLSKQKQHNISSQILIINKIGYKWNCIQYQITIWLYIRLDQSIYIDWKLVTNFITGASVATDSTSCRHLIDMLLYLTTSNVGLSFSVQDLIFTYCCLFRCCAKCSPLYQLDLSSVSLSSFRFSLHFVIISFSVISSQICVNNRPPQNNQILKR